MKDYDVGTAKVGYWVIRCFDSIGRVRTRVCVYVYMHAHAPTMEEANLMRPNPCMDAAVDYVQILEMDFHILPERATIMVKLFSLLVIMQQYSLSTTEGIFSHPFSVLYNQAPLTLHIFGFIQGNSLSPFLFRCLQCVRACVCFRLETTVPTGWVLNTINWYACVRDSHAVFLYKYACLMQ